MGASSGQKTHYKAKTLTGPPPKGTAPDVPSRTTGLESVKFLKQESVKFLNS